MVGTRTLLGVVILTGLAGVAPMARAQEEVARTVPPVRDPRLVNDPRDERIEGDGRLIPAPPRADDFTRPLDDDPPAFDADIEVRLELPAYRWLPRRVHRADFMHQVSLTRLPPGSLVVRYEGIEGYLVRKTQSRMKSLWRESIKDAWEAGILDDQRYDSAIEHMYESLSDFRAGGRWWERSWLDSLTPERGGAPATPFVQKIGERIDVFSLGPVRFTNDFKARVDRVTILSFDPDGGQIHRDFDLRRLAREHARLQRAGDDLDERDDELPALTGEPPDGGLAEPMVRIALEPPEPGILPGYWRLRFRPSAGLDLLGDPSEIVEELSMRVALELFLGESRVKFLEVEALASYEFEDNSASIGIEFSLLTW
jgi:hypothetical protein